MADDQSIDDIQPTEPKPYKDLLTDREKMELLEKLGTVPGMADAIDLEHKTYKLTEDDVWRLMAVDAYNSAVKHPFNGQLHKEDASVILGLLNKLTDECLVKEFKNRIGHRDRALADARSVFARMTEILIKRRKLEKLVNAS